MSKLKELKDLPSQQGFEFVGVKRGGGYVYCRIHNSLDSGYVILTQHSNRRIYDELIGWLEDTSEAIEE